MNRRQSLAFNNPCYTSEDGKNPVSVETFEMDGLQVTSIIKVHGCFDDSLWNGIAIVHDRDGNKLKEADLTGDQVSELKEHVYLLLKDVGTGEIKHCPDLDESEFETLRMLNEYEKKRLKEPNIFEVFKIKERQNFALQNPCPGVMDMMQRKFTNVIYFGGLKFSTLLTINRDDEGFMWHGSCAVLDERDNAIKFIDTPYGHAKMRIKVVSKMLQNVGVGKMFTSKFDKEDTIFNVFKKVSPLEEMKFPKTAHSNIDPAEILRQAMRN